VEGEYWLKRQQRIGHWAKVHVRVEPGLDRSVQVSPDACAWVRGVYGESASADVPGDLRAGAVTGARFALAEAGVAGAVTVTEIDYTNADTSADDVRFATAWAVWQAIGHQPRHAPWIDQDGV
jgi:hypothetical protein